MYIKLIAIDASNSFFPHFDLFYEQIHFFSFANGGKNFNCVRTCEFQYINICKDIFLY